MVSATFFSVVEVSQQLGVCADFVEIGRWVEKKGCGSACQEARNYPFISHCGRKPLVGARTLGFDCLFCF